MIQNKNAKDLINQINKSQTKEGKWKNNFNYKAAGYIVFDKNRKESEWTTQIIKQALKKQKIDPNSV